MKEGWLAKQNDNHTERFDYIVFH